MATTTKQPKRVTISTHAASNTKGTEGAKGTKGTKAKRAPLSKRALLLRSIKHGIYMLLIIVCGSVGTHYALTSITRHEARCTVPHFESLTMAEAEEIAAMDDLRLIINDSLYAPMYKGGAILDQLPKAGVVVKPGRTIYLTVNATQRRVVDVPYVAERSLRQARNMLEMVGLSIKELIYEDDLAENYILSQYIDNKRVKSDSKERAPIGTEVTLHVGRGSQNETMYPLLMGMTLREAKSALWNAGLNLGVANFDDGIEPTSQMQSKVYAQSVRAEELGQLGERINLNLSNSQQKVDSMIVLYHKELEEERIMLEMMQEVFFMEEYDGEEELYIEE